jgi:aldehyde dehydrogenase (NAD+)
MFIGGEWTEAVSGDWTNVYTPRRRDTLIARTPRGNADDVDRAVSAARAAFPAWKGRHFLERQKLLLQIADDIDARRDELAALTALDTGNALTSQALPEAAMLADLFRYYAGVASEAKGAVLPAGDGQLQYTRLEPLGVVGCIIPWNSPLAIAGYKIPAALAVGNTVVVKPAEDAPLTILALAEICARHLPAGTLNVVTGPGSVCGNAIVNHPGIDKVSFTGSTEVGQGIAEKAASRFAHVSLELGGKNPSIVFPDAVDDALIDGLLLASRVHRQGQSCTAGSRMYVHESVYDEVVVRLATRLEGLRVGDPLDPATEMGALINSKQFQAVSQYVDEGLHTPAVGVALDGSIPSNDPLEEGYFLRPTLFTARDNTWRLAREEIFGPVVVALPWRDWDEVVAMANDSHYGLGAFVWTHSLDDAVRTAHALEAGWIQVNQGGGQMVGQSYGGYKASGIGREISREGMVANFTQTKQINIRLNSASGPAA